MRRHRALAWHIGAALLAISAQCCGAIAIEPNPALPSYAEKVGTALSGQPNSHFYSADPGECQWLKGLEQHDRAAASGAVLGWGFEGLAFRALAPQDGGCPAGSIPVYRAYNNLAADSNHRVVVDARTRSAMIWSWLDEGIAFRSPQSARAA